MHDVLPRLRVLVLPKPSLCRQLFDEQSIARLHRYADVTLNPEERDWTSEELAQKIANFDAVVTGWNSPRFTDEVLAAAKRLKLIVHSAGSVRFMLPDDILERGFTVTTAAAAMAPAVAETTLLFIMLLLRPLHRQDHGLRAAGDWGKLKAEGMAHEIAGQRVGMIGAGYVGRSVAQLLNAVGVKLSIYDPYLTDQLAATMGATRVHSLEDLIRSNRIISLHAPATPETRHMIGAPELALLADGGMLINTARPALVDSEALLAELQSGRISAALDVFDDEPLPVTSPFRQLPNVFLSPHLGAATVQCRYRQGQITAEEIARFASGDPLKFALAPHSIAIMA